MEKVKASFILGDFPSGTIARKALSRGLILWPQIGSISLTWKPLCNAHSQVSPQTCWVINCGLHPNDLCFHRHSQWTRGTLKSTNHWLYWNPLQVLKAKICICTCTWNRSAWDLTFPCSYWLANNVSLQTLVPWEQRLNHFGPSLLSTIALFLPTSLHPRTQREVLTLALCRYIC